jgi:hypothetical protein
MTSLRSRIPTRSGSGSAQGRTVILATDQTDGASLVVFRPRPWHRLLARVHALTLDEELAAGLPADGGRARAVRAAMLVAPAAREKLARDWERVLHRAHGAREGADPRVPLARARILDAKNDIPQLVAALRADLPVPARGAAMANLLLIDGTSPVYGMGRRHDLRSAVQEATQNLDPWTPLTGSRLDR